MADRIVPNQLRFDLRPIHSTRSSFRKSFRYPCSHTYSERLEPPESTDFCKSGHCICHELGYRRDRPRPRLVERTDSSARLDAVSRQCPRYQYSRFDISRRRLVCHPFHKSVQPRLLAGE